jgi:hypothetical protein
VIYCFAYGNGDIAFSLHFGEGAGKFFIKVGDHKYEVV